MPLFWYCWPGQRPRPRCFSRVFTKVNRKNHSSTLGMRDILPYFMEDLLFFPREYTPFPDHDQGWSSLCVIDDFLPCRH
jgi:hypothetical protein